MHSGEGALVGTARGPISGGTLRQSLRRHRSQQRAEDLWKFLEPLSEDAVDWLTDEEGAVPGG